VSGGAELEDDQVRALVRDGYDAVAPRYAAYAAGPTSHPRHTWLATLLERTPRAAEVLELGCGPGVPAAAAIVAAGHRFTGVDISAGQLDIARRLVPGATFVEADMMTLEVPPSSFDAVVAFYSLIHVPRRHYPTLFSRIRAWLRPGGWFLASFGTGDSPGWIEDDLLGLGAPNWTNSHDPAETGRLLREAGLVAERSEVVVQDEPTGAERWLYVLARPA